MIANHKKLAFFYSCTTLIISCAGPESYQQKMARYTPKSNEIKNIVPSVQVGNYHFPSNYKGRIPASTTSGVSIDSERKESNTTNKKLYFLTLLSQYESLKDYSQNFTGPEINICPYFHTSLVKFHDSTLPHHKVSVTKNYTYDINKLKDDHYLSRKPEFSLPLSKDEVFPKVIDVINSSGKISETNVNDLIHKALDIHLTKTYSEIRELCEYGSSDNYYAYENLITYITNNKFEADSSNLNTLLKTTLFSNMAILNSLENQASKNKIIGRGIASVSEDVHTIQYNSEVINRLNVNWIKSYFDYIKN